MNMWRSVWGIAGPICFLFALYTIFTPWSVNVFPAAFDTDNHPHFIVYNNTPFTLRSVTMGCKPQGKEFGSDDVEIISITPRSEPDISPSGSREFSCLARHQDETTKFDYIIAYNLFGFRIYRNMPFEISASRGLFQKTPISGDRSVDFSFAR